MCVWVCVCACVCVCGVCVGVCVGCVWVCVWGCGGVCVCVGCVGECVWVWGCVGGVCVRDIMCDDCRFIYHISLLTTIIDDWKGDCFLEIFDNQSFNRTDVFQQILSS